MRLTALGRALGCVPQVHLRAAPSPPAENPPPVVIKGIDGAPAVSIAGAAYNGGSLRGLTLVSDEGPTNAPMEAPAGTDEGGEQGTGEEEAGAARQCVVLCGGALAAGEAEQFEIHGCRVEGGKASAAGVHIFGADVRVALTDTTVKSTGGWGVLCAGGGVVILSDCELLENTRGDGIVLSGECNPTVESTQVSGNGRNGVAVLGNARGIFDTCDIWENLNGIAVAEWGNSMFRNAKLAALCGMTKRGGSLTSTTVHGSREHGLYLRGASCPVVRQAVLYRNGGAPVVMQEGASGRFEECGEMGGAALTLRALLRRAGEAKARWRELQPLGPEVRQEAHQGVPGSPPVALAQVDTQLRALDCTVREIEEHMTASIPELSTLSALQEQRRTLAAEIAATLTEACRELPERVRRAEEAAERMTAAAESHRARQLLAGAAEGGAGQQEEARGSEAEAQWRPCGVVEAAGDAAAEERTRCVMTLPAREGKCTQLVEELEDLELKQQELKHKEVELQHIKNPVRKRRKLLLACARGPSQLGERGGEAEKLMTQKRALRRQHYALQLSLRQQVALLPEFMADAGLFGGSEKGLWVSRTVDGDYEGVRVLAEDARREVLQASFIGGPLPHPCVLKRFAVGDGGARHAAEKEVSILARLRHPLVVPIEAVFHDAVRGCSYLQLPFATRGTLREWGSQTSPNARLRETHTMARAVFQAVAYIHGAQVLHRDIKPSNILVRDDGRPQLADFDVSRDIRTGDRTATTTAAGPQKGTLGYMAPEVEARGEATQASDCWSAGAVLYWLHFGEVPAPHRSGGVLVPPAADDALRELLEALLQQEPSRRPSAAEALVSAYMMQGPGGPEGAPGPASQRQMVALHAHVRQVQRGVRGGLPLHLVRHPREGQAASRVLDPKQVLHFFKEVDLSKLRRGLVVSFHGEEGVDAAGLTTEMYTQLWEEVVRPGVGLFERGERGGVLPVRDSMEGGAAAENLPELLRAAGRAMAKCIYDRRLVRADFAPSLYKFLTGSALSRNDLDHFNPEYGRQMTMLLITPGHVGHLEFETLDNEEALSEQNKVQYVREKISEMLAYRIADALRRANNQ
ncbi:hypothetical protein CYMTET_55658 [Cymbomonas tetramitiformis]|uniref:Protein kinase domain-containing protein n=1 Tax=Cymbomonas tetramitiformis TaxID=36881 RepID=A0AAE0BCV8_9CHLO|nr:hypothetical protein CYMTET_55658 [Cymbomonas tetramitiformis]